MRKATVLLVRHGHTSLNSGEAVERLRGWLDVPLTAEGKKEAEKVAAKLKGQPIAKVFSSDMARAKDTAEAIAKTTGAKVSLSPSLRPWNVGTLAGKPVKEVTPDMKRYMENPDRTIPNGESFNRFLNRWSGALKTITGVAERSPDKVVVAVTHLRNILATPHILRNERGPIPMKDGAETGSVLILENEGEGWHIEEDDEEQEQHKVTQRASVYMELEGAKKDSECYVVEGEISSELGCCNLFEPQGEAKKFTCGTCIYVDRD